MKIGITGTQSVGKTTLVNDLSKLPELKDYYFATERSVYLRDLGIPLNTDSTTNGQMIFTAERASELLHPNLITDRTMWDVNAFTFASETIKWVDKARLMNCGYILKKQYDVIFYISPAGIPIEDNNIRSIDPEYRILIDDHIQYLLEVYPPKKLIHLSGSTEERVNKILKYINE